ncbi:MAG: CheY-like chemotaxis protein, partial [Woeseiaceae bacterium]
QGGLTLEEEPMKLNDCIEAALDVVSKQAADKRLDLSYQIDSSIPQTFTGDHSRLRQVFVNLLGNAVKFTGNGEIAITAEVLEATGKNIEIQFAVEDTGIGIAAETIDSLFQPFQQADVSTSRKFGGTGLGLSISRQLAELMGGKMWVESRVGVGSTFYFTANFSVNADQNVSAGRTLYAAKKSVIVMNRNPLFGASVKSMIEGAGGTVHNAESEDEAVEIIHSIGGVDLIMINDNVDGLDGVAGGAIARSLQAEAPDSKIVLLRNLGVRFTTGFDSACLLKPLKQSAMKQLFFNGESPLISTAEHALSGGRGRAGDREPSRKAVSNLKVLLVEDNLVNQKVAVRMLDRLGYHADVAGNGAIAVDAVLEKGYDVVFMDIQMPHMDGISATAAIRGHQDVKRQPFIIALTANATTEDRRKCLEGGMDDYASKPVSTEILGRLLEKATVAQRMRHGSLMNAS